MVYCTKDISDFDFVYPFIDEMLAEYELWDLEATYTIIFTASGFRVVFKPYEVNAK